LTDPWDFADDEVTGDMTLYAKWTAEIPDTGEEANMGLGLLGIGLGLWLFSRKTKKLS
jgi:LPXTG-motif cell wall-anchored protein